METNLRGVASPWPRDAASTQNPIGGGDEAVIYRAGCWEPVDLADLADASPPSTPAVPALSATAVPFVPRSASQAALEPAAAEAAPRRSPSPEAPLPPWRRRPPDDDGDRPPGRLTPPVAVEPPPSYAWGAFRMRKRRRPVRVLTVVRPTPHPAK